MKHFYIQFACFVSLVCSSCTTKRCAEGVEFLFICAEGVEVTEGKDGFPASCTHGYSDHLCTEAQESEPSSQFQFNDEFGYYIRICTPACQSWHDSKAFCYEDCEAANEQEGVYCIRGSGNQWLLDENVTTDCPDF